MSVWPIQYCAIYDLQNDDTAAAIHGSASMALYCIRVTTSITPLYQSDICVIDSLFDALEYPMSGDKSCIGF